MTPSSGGQKFPPRSEELVKYSTGWLGLKLALCETWIFVYYEVNAKSSCLNKSNNFTNFLLSYSQNCTIKCACLTSHDEGASSAQSRTEPTGLCVSVCAFCLWSRRSGVTVTACLYVQCRCSVDGSWVCRSGWVKEGGRKFRAFGFRNTSRPSGYAAKLNVGL